MTDTAKPTPQDVLREVKLDSRLLQMVFKYLDIALFVIDVTPDGRFIFAGLSSAEVRGKQAHDFFAPDTAIAVEANYRQCLALRKTIEYATKTICPTPICFCGLC